MKEILLQWGLVTLVDDGDFEILSKHTWYAERPTLNGSWYVQRTIQGKHERMHRVILGVTTDVDVDHIDHNGLNNQRCNLRLATTSQNSANSRRKAGVSGYRGVWPKRDKWQAIITGDDKRISLGSFSTPEDAALAWNEVALQRYGEFAKLNKINE